MCGGNAWTGTCHAGEQCFSDTEGSLRTFHLCGHSHGNSSVCDSGAPHAGGVARWGAGETMLPSHCVLQKVNWNHFCPNVDSCYDFDEKTIEEA